MVVRVQSMDPELNLSELSVCRARAHLCGLSVCQTKQTPSPDKFVRAQRLPSRANAELGQICPSSAQRLPNQANAEPGEICSGSAFTEPERERQDFLARAR